MKIAPYFVLIRRNSDGVTATYEYDLPWHDSSAFMWTDGNASCDCNRALYFARARGEPEPRDEDLKCGETRYSVLKIWNATGPLLEPVPPADGL